MLSLLRRFFPHFGAAAVKPGHDGRMHLVEGRRGRGKSYAMQWWVRTAVEERIPVYVNWLPDRYKLAAHVSARQGVPMSDVAEWVAEHVRVVQTWDEILVSEDALVLLDEASRIFDSRNRGAVPAVAFEWLQQSRKLELTIVMASQSFDWLDVRVRQLADTLWLTRKETGKDGLPSQFYLYGVDPWAGGLSEKAMRDGAHSLMQLPFQLNLAETYNSWELIHLLSGDPEWSTVGELAAALGREHDASECLLRERIALPRVPLAAT